MSEYPHDWTNSNLGAHLTETKERAGDSDAIPYSVSKVLGIVPQSEKFNKRVASSDISNYKVIRKGDFAYDPMLLWDGSINRMLRDGMGAVSPAYVTFKVVSSSLDADYLLHLLKANTTKNFYKSISKGTNVRRQKAEFADFAAGEFAFPPLPEQKKIAEILSGIDYAIQKNTLSLNKKFAVKQGLTKDIFERVQTNSQAVPLDELLERPLAYGVLKPGPSVPNGVQLVKIQDYKDGRISTKNLHRISKELHHEFRRTELKGGEIIISVVGTIGRVAVVPKELAGANVSRAFAVLACHGKINNQYLAHFLGSSRIQQWFNDQCQGNAQQVLNLGTLRELPVPVPSSEEQTEIILSINSIDASIARNRKVLAQLHVLKNAISSDLLSGRKRVSV